MSLTPAPADERWREPILFVLVGIYFFVSAIAYTDYPRAEEGVRLTDLERAGLEVWRRHNCQACHQLHGFGGFLGPDLTNLIDDDREDEEFVSILRDGSRQMPALGLPAGDQEAVLSFLRAMNRSGRSQPSPPPGMGPEAAAAPDHLPLLLDTAAREVGETLDPRVREGGRLWTRTRCGSCHLAFQIGRKRAPDLSLAVVNRSPAALKAIFTTGRRSMPSFPLTDDEIGAMSAFLEAAAARRSTLVRLNAGLPGREPFRWSALPWFEYR